MTTLSYMQGALHKAMLDVRAKEFEYATNEVRINFALSLEEIKLLLSALEAMGAKEASIEGN